MATCDSPPMVSSRQQEHGGQKSDAAAEDNSAVAMETGFAHGNNARSSSSNRSSPVAVIGEPENGVGDRAPSPLRTTAIAATVSASVSAGPMSEQSRRESFTTGNTASVPGTLPGGEGAALGSDCAASARSPPAPPPLPAQDIPCNECSGSFSSLQKYMEHHCPNARLPATAGGRGTGEEPGEESEAEEEEQRGEGLAGPGETNSEVEEEEEEEEEEEVESDVENLCGEIVYQPDGSAFILEDSKEQRGGDQGGRPGALHLRGLLSPQAFPAAPAGSEPGGGLSPGGERSEKSAAPMSFYPQIINTFHIASSLGTKPPAADHPSFPNTSTGGLAPAATGPVLHSFRVYDLRHKSDKDYLLADGAAKKSCVSKDVPNNVDLSKFEGCVADGRRKPVLMCFLCKLSFGYSRSFVTHAVHDHRMTLNEQEQKLLGNKHVSAIVQGVGKDKEPLISFLEPKKSPGAVLPHYPAPAAFPGPDPGLRGLWSAAFHGGGDNGADTLQAGFAFLKGSASSSAANDQNPRSQPMPKAETDPAFGGGALGAQAFYGFKVLLSLRNAFCAL